MSIISNPTKRIIPENFHVPLSKDFTQENCDFNKLLWCNELKPEWFGAIEHMGLTYAGHCLMSSNKLKGARTHGLVQLFRPGINPKYAEIKASIHTTGKDIREQPTFLLLEDDDTPLILIDTNTVDDIYEKGGAQNRIVAKFKKNQYYSEANLIACGTYFNSLGLPSGINDIQKKQYQNNWIS